VTGETSTHIDTDQQSFLQTSHSNRVHRSNVQCTCALTTIPRGHETLAISVASALVSPRLDYANSVLFGCPQKHAACLQSVQQALGRVVTQQSSVSPLTSTELLKQLHWLPIEWRIRFKLACLVTKFSILVTRHILPSSYNTTSPQGPRVHLPVTYFLFRDTTSHLVLALSVLLRPKYGTPYLFTSANPKHTLPSDVILRRTTFF